MTKAHLNKKADFSPVSRVLRKIRDVDGLISAGYIAQEDQHAFEALAEQYDIGITDHVAGLIDSGDRGVHGAVARQFVPSLEEARITQKEMDDPIGDEAYSPVKGIVHRYPDRVLLKASHVCAVYCRYCFRRDMIGAGSDFLKDDDLDQAINYIRSHGNVWEVILTGGDPLVLSARKLESILSALGEIEHVQTVRIHSRVPVVNPDQITDTILSVLESSKKPVYIVLHINHADELSEKSVRLFRALRGAGCSLLSQSVLLAGVNDDPAVLEALFKNLIVHHVKPYYLHHPDMAKGTSHFRVSVARGREIVRALRGRISGICMPTYVLDIPGGFGKIPIEHVYCYGHEDARYVLEDFKGAIHTYEDDL